MPAKQTAKQTLDREFLEIRCQLLDIASSLDRIDRAPAPEAVRGDSRLAHIREAVSVLQIAEPDRARRVQMVFSLPYDDDWKTAKD